MVRKRLVDDSEYLRFGLKGKERTDHFSKMLRCSICGFIDGSRRVVQYFVRNIDLFKDIYFEFSSFSYYNFNLATQYISVMNADFNMHFIPFLKDFLFLIKRFNGKYVHNLPKKDKVFMDEERQIPLEDGRYLTYRDWYNQQQYYYSKIITMFLKHITYMDSISYYIHLMVYRLDVESVAEILQTVVTLPRKEFKRWEEILASIHAIDKIMEMMRVVPHDAALSRALHFLLRRVVNDSDSTFGEDEYILTRVSSYAMFLYELMVAQTTLTEYIAIYRVLRVLIKGKGGCPIVDRVANLIEKRIYFRGQEKTLDLLHELGVDTSNLVAYRTQTIHPTPSSDYIPKSAQYYYTAFSKLSDNPPPFRLPALFLIKIQFLVSLLSFHSNRFIILFHAYRIANFLWQLCFLFPECLHLHASMRLLLEYFEFTTPGSTHGLLQDMINECCVLENIMLWGREYYARENGQYPRIDTRCAYLIEYFKVFAGLREDCLTRMSKRNKKKQNTSEHRHDLRFLRILALMSDEQWFYIKTVFYDKHCRKEELSYSSVKKMESFMDDCVDEPFERYLYFLSLRNLPLPNILGKKK
ncbi:hypothetical protein TCON_1445 [Astathelohania contejeani]|uniref:Uncharacterized protein n=1 Tax=Astathelohania contejeani TaxID=164912 RepID=A0ABQ7HYZ9_9MICR|nr:hypothetical protein TCON_1445 [Thelohania contejeani]